MSSQYCTYDITPSIYETTSSTYGNIYTIQETSQPLSLSSHPKYRQHHTHTLYDIKLPICVASFALYKSSHPHFLTSNLHVYVITATIFDIVSTLCGWVITSTVLMIWQKLYFWDHIRYSSQHHIHCIRHDTHCITSQPLLMASDSLHITSPPGFMTYRPL